MKTSGRIVSFSFFFFWVFVLPDLLYLAWPRINATIDQLAFIFHDSYFRKFTILILTTNVITLLTYNLVMYVIYVSKFDFFEQYRVSKEQWPWEKNFKAWRIMLKKSIFLTLLNATLISYISLYTLSKLQDISAHYELSSINWPQKTQILFDFICYILGYEISVYWLHLIFHINPFLYSLHKEHHSYNICVSTAAIDANPIEFVFSNILSSTFGVIVLSLFKKVHIVTICIWVSFRLMQACEVHTGYDFPWGILKFVPGKADSNFHDFHHSHNSGCYGGFFKLVDQIMNTDAEYNRYYKLDEKQN